MSPLPGARVPAAGSAIWRAADRGLDQPRMRGTGAQQRPREPLVAVPGDTAAGVRIDGADAAAVETVTDLQIADVHEDCRLSEARREVALPITQREFSPGRWPVSSRTERVLDVPTTIDTRELPLENRPLA